nr:MAG TPA: hypothetical protein [Caudoviricetes sp.]
MIFSTNFFITSHSAGVSCPKAIKVLSIKSSSVFRALPTILAASSARLKSGYILPVPLRSHSSLTPNSLAIHLIVALLAELAPFSI